jgi:hypothetical protein
MDYSIKKAIATFFLLFAGTIILAHAVIPHHHHDGIPVAVRHEHNGNMPDHSRTDQLHEFRILIKANERMDNDQYPDFDINGFSCLFSDYSQYLNNDDIGRIYTQLPYIQSFHTEFIARSTGMRAPPNQLSIRN